MFTQAFLKASNTLSSAQFGHAVAIDGDTLAVCALHMSTVDDGGASDSGAVYVFVLSGGVWEQQAYLRGSDAATADQFCSSVKVSGNTMVVGAPNKASQAGKAYVFFRSGATWSQQQILAASNANGNDRFAHSVSISGETVAVGSTGESSAIANTPTNNAASAAGAVYVFTRSGTTWTEEAYLKAPNIGSNDQFGVDVSVDGDTLLVTSWGEDSSASVVNGADDNNALETGAAFVFVRSGGVWTQQAYLKADNPSVSDRFGWACALSGNTAVVGTYFEASNATGVNGDGTNNNAAQAGAVYVFTRSGTTWMQQAYVKASNTQANDNFGKERVRLLV